MNAVAAQQKFGYGNGTVKTARDIEYEAFSRITSMLRRAIASGDRHAEIEAVDMNNQLWTILSADLASSGNALPNELKANLLSLANFSTRHGHTVLRGKASADVLVEVNLSIMKGLRSEVQS